MPTLQLPVSDADHIQGSGSATVTLVEYGDFQDPSCLAAHPELRKLQHRFRNDLRFVFRHFPQVDVHPEAEAAAEMAEFAGAHGRFWLAHDLLFENQDRLSPNLYFEIVDELGLKPDDLLMAARLGVYRPRIRKELKGGMASGVERTPALFLNGVLWEQASLASLTAAIDSLR